MISHFGLPGHDENNFYDGCYLDVISGNVLNQLCTYRKDRKGITYSLVDPGVRFNQAVCSLQWVITRCVSKCITTRATQHISVEWTKKECSDFKFVHWNSLHPVSSLPGIVFMSVFSKDFMDMIQCVNILRIVETIVTDHSEMFLRNMNNQFFDQRSSWFCYFDA